MATSKEHFYLFNSSGQLVSGAVITVRAVGGSTTLFTFDEPDTVDHPGLYVLVADTGEYDVYINGVKQIHISPWLHIDSDVLPVPIAGATNMFGDGADGTYTLDGVQGTVSGLFTRDSATQYTMQRTGFFDTLTVSPGVTLRGNGFQIFGKTEIIDNGSIDNSGGAGGNGNPGVGLTGGTGGAAGSAGLGNFFQTPRPGIAGAAGGSGSGGFSGDAGAASTATNASLGIGQNGVVGGNGGGAGTNRGAAGAAGGSQLSAAHGGIRYILAGMMGRIFTASTVVSFTTWGGNAGSGGGGSGAAGTGTRGSGGGAGGGGGNGGNLCVAAATLSGNGTIFAKGGAGGNGGDGSGNVGTAGGGGGGGGGNGGNGGSLAVVYNDADGWTGTISAAGGLKGTGGAGGTVTGGGTSGQTAPDGNNGLDGVRGVYQV